MKKAVRRCLIIGISVFVAGIVFDFAGNVVAGIRIFNELPAQGAAEAEHLGSGVRTGLLSTAVGIAISAIGLGLVVGSVIVHAITKERAKAGTSDNSSAPGSGR